jgi:BirA family transcriptional regulator, biotin operon repressor / biotin---[acetyl-CoA-carboxylase] ligase
MIHNSNVGELQPPACPFRPMYDLARIAAARLVAGIDFHESIGSTSDHALAQAAAGEVALPLLVLAERQTGGRGRGANRWWTEAGALTFSLALEAPSDRLPPERWPQVALATGLAVYNALAVHASADELHLKWPNDVYLGCRKVGGILSESVPGWRDRLVVGIGVNVNNRVQGLGVKVQGQANGNHETADGRRDSVNFVGTSLVEHNGVEQDLTGVLLSVLDEFDRCWQQLLDDDFARLADEYRQRCFLTGKIVAIEQVSGERIVGVCQGIANNGALRVRSADGERAIISGTVASWEATTGTG